MPTKLIIYSDGGARGNPGPAAIGVLICDENNEPLFEHGEVIGETTNNVAEYSAVIKGLELAKKFDPEEVSHFVDSQLVAYQISGKYQIKMPHLLKLCQQVKEKAKNFKRFTITQVPRTHEKLRVVDGLVNQALDEAGH